MLSRTLLRIQIQVDRFIVKAGRKNDPLEAYRKSDEYLTFQNKIEDIIGDQIVYLADHLSEVTGIWSDDEPAEDSVIEAKVGDFLDKHMPAFAAGMDYDTVYDNLLAAFEASVQGAYKRIGVKMIRKVASDYDYSVDFELTNQNYLDALANDANYLLNTKSKSYDQTTKDRLVNIVKQGRLNRDTIDDIASDLKAQVEGISSVRGFMIANTETAQAFGTANQAFMAQNDIPTKEWIIAGPHNLTDECDLNAEAGEIPVNDEFPSGDMNEPAHTNCECYVNGTGLDLTTMSDDELNSLVLWDGS